MTTQVAEQAAARASGAAVSVGVPILAAKFTAPNVPDWALPRPRITELLAGGTGSGPLTVLTGPAGAGKTMALALWAVAETGPVAWVSVDEYDNRPGIFWTYVAGALRRADIAVPAALPAAPGRESGRLLSWLAAALAAQDSPVTLVLDDLHLLTDVTVLDELGYLLRNAGPALRLVVSARMDPLPLHRYRLAGELTEIRASDLAFTVAEAGLLLGRHGITLTADSLKTLTRRTEGWAAGLRLAAISMGTHPDPDQFVTELITEDSALTGYLVEEVLSTQPPEVRDVLLSTSILDQVSGEAASELTGNQQAAGTLAALARANAFVQPIGGGWYRYHTLLAEVLRLELKREHPERLTFLHRAAARWYGRNGQLTDAVRHAAVTGDWPLAAGIVVDALAIGQIIEPRGSPSLAGEFAGMPRGQAWPEPQPHLVSAAIALSEGRHESSAAALDAADGILARLPDQEAAGRLAAALIRLAASRRTGDFTAAGAAAAGAEALIGQVPAGTLTRNPKIRACVLSGRGAVQLWAGCLGDAARTFESGADAVTASGGQDERAECLGHLALVEALQGRLRRAASVAAQATAARTSGEQRPPVPPPHPAALVALAWVHLEHNELREAHRRLKQADAVLGVTPDKLIEAVARLAAAYGELAQGHPAAVAQITASARSGWPVPAWLGQRLSLVQSQAYAAAGDIHAALAAVARAGRDDSPETAVTRAHAWLAAGDAEKATRALAPALTTDGGTPARVHLQARLLDAHLGYHCGDRARGRRSLVFALRLAEREQLRLPFAIEQRWIGPVLRRDPELAYAHRHLLTPVLYHEQLPAPRHVPDQAPILLAEPLTEREREVLRHVSRLLNSAEIASEMSISIHTVKTHLTHIYRKLATSRRGEAVRRARQLKQI